MPDPDDMLPDYDLAAMGPPVVGKHYEDYQRHVRVVRLTDKLSDRFPDEASVVSALERFALDHPKAPGLTTDG